MSFLPGMIPGGASGAIAVTVTDDGDVASPTSGASTSIHRFAAQTSTGPFSILCIGINSSSVTLVSAMWNSSAMTIHVQQASSNKGCAIASIAGTQSGEIALTFSGSLTDSSITKLSLNNVRSRTAIDTDAEAHASGGADLDSLASPGIGGIRVAMYVNGTQGTAVSWTNATEVSDFDAGQFRHSVAYDTGPDATAITADGASDAEAIVGVSWR